MTSRISRLFKRDREVDCGHVRGVSSDYIEGELDEEAAAAVKAHLEWCNACRAFISTLRATIRLLGSSRRPGAPASFRERLRQRLGGEAHQ